MYKVIIADSRYHKGTKDKYTVDWNALGFNVVCIAKTPLELTAFISSSEADLVFMDMDFTGTKSEELVRHIHAHCPYAKIVAVGEQSDYEAIKAAFGPDIFDYVIRKTLSADTIKDILSRFRVSENKNDFLRTVNMLEGADEYLRKRKRIINLLCQKSDDKSVTGMLIAAVRIFNYPLLKQIHSPDDLSILMHNIITTIMQVIKTPPPIIYQDNDNNIVICMQFDEAIPETAIMNSINAYVRRIDFLVKKFFNLSLSWGISSLSSEEYSLGSCYREALEMLKDTPIAERKARFDVPELSAISLDEEKKVLYAIQTLDYDSIDRCLDTIFADRIHGNLSAHILTGELMTIANRLCSELNIDLSKAENSLFQANTFPEDDSDSEAELEWCKNLFHSIIRMHLEHTRPSRHSTYARFVRTYIAENYKEDISLKAIAETMGITEQYLSKIFKEETGEKLSSYLSRFRIDKAKELLESDVNIKYLYSEVGFKNYNYFFVAFKKSVGCTPVEYKKSHVRKNPFEGKKEAHITSKKGKAKK